MLILQGLLVLVKNSDTKAWERGQDAFETGSMLFFMLMVLSWPVSSSRLFLFDRSICTGLGDRVGTMLSLAALARVENASIAFLWCKDPSVIVQDQCVLMQSGAGSTTVWTRLRD